MATPSTPTPPLTPPPQPFDLGEQKAKFFDRVLKWGAAIASIAIIPLVVWIFSVENRIAEMKKDIAIIQERNRNYEGKLADLKNISRELTKIANDNNKGLIKFNGEFRVVNINIGHIDKNMKRLETQIGKLNAILKGN